VNLAGGDGDPGGLCLAGAWRQHADRRVKCHSTSRLPALCRRAASSA
jgi:hypothetical protein